MLPNQAERFISIPKKCLPDFRTKIRTSGRHSLHKNIVYIDKFHFRIKIDAFILDHKNRRAGCQKFCFNNAPCSP